MTTVGSDFEARGEEVGAPIRAILAEDDVLVRAGLEALLATRPEIELLDSCDSLGALLAAVEQHRPDVVLTDIRMPPSSTDEGVQAARTLRSSHPDVGVVVLSQYVDPQLAIAVLEDGSSGRGYLLKENVADIEHVVAALSAVAAGGSFIESDVVDALVAARAHGPGTELDRLTERELEVLAEMAAGRSNAAIGERLFIGARAVEKHISSIFVKLELEEHEQTHRRVAAVLLFLSGNR